MPYRWACDPDVWGTPIYLTELRPLVWEGYADSIFETQTDVDYYLCFVGTISALVGFPQVGKHVPSCPLAYIALIGRYVTGILFQVVLNPTHPKQDPMFGSKSSTYYIFFKRKLSPPYSSTDVISNISTYPNCPCLCSKRFYGRLFQVLKSKLRYSSPIASQCGECQGGRPRDLGL